MTVTRLRVWFDDPETYKSVRRLRLTLILSRLRRETEGNRSRIFYEAQASHCHGNAGCRHLRSAASPSDVTQQVTTYG